MRLSTRLLWNASSSYVRMACTFALGIFLTAFMIGEVGLVGHGMAVFSETVAFGMAAAVEAGIRREMAAALATGTRDRIQRMVASAMLFSLGAAAALMAFFALVALAATLGMFRTPPDLPRMPSVLAWLFLAEGLALGLRTLAGPFTLAVFASQRVGMDNLFMVWRRLVGVAAAVIAFLWLWPEADLLTRLRGYATIRLILAVTEVVLEVSVARRLIPDLRLVPRAFDPATFRQIALSVWHNGQFHLLPGITASTMPVLINVFFGLTFNGVWGIVTQIGGQARQVADGVLRGVDPLSAHLKERGQRDAIVNLMIQGIRYQLLVVLPFVLTYAVFLVPILWLWVGDRLAGDEHLAAAGLTVDEAIRLTAIMAAVSLANALFIASTRGVERMLYGMGEIRSYVWFAKYAAIASIGGAALVMWLAETPVLVPVPLALANFISLDVLVLRAAARRVGLPIRRTLLQSLPRPMLAAALLAAPMLVLRWQVQTLSLPGLIGLLAACGVWYGLVVVAVGVSPSERARLMELAGRAVRWRPSRSAP